MNLGLLVALRAGIEAVTSLRRYLRESLVAPNVSLFCLVPDSHDLVPVVGADR